MALFKCNSCNQQYEDYYPPDDTCIKCNKGTIHIITSQGEKTMTAITPAIKLHTRAEDGGTHINSLIMKHNGNAYHLYASTKDIIYIFQESIALYVLNINKINGTIGLNAYMSPEPFPLNSFYMHNVKEIVDVFGTKWEQLPAVTVTMKLINYLC
jgi:hypothetical protein